MVPASLVIAGLWGRRLAARRTSWERFMADFDYASGHSIARLSQGYAIGSLDGSPIACRHGRRASRSPPLGLKLLEFHGIDSIAVLIVGKLPGDHLLAVALECAADLRCKIDIALGEARRELLEQAQHVRRYHALAIAIDPRSVADRWHAKARGDDPGDLARDALEDDGEGAGLLERQRVLQQPPARGRVAALNLEPAQLRRILRRQPDMPDHRHSRLVHGPEGRHDCSPAFEL